MVSPTYTIDGVTQHDLLILASQKYCRHFKQHQAAKRRAQNKMKKKNRKRQHR